MQKAIAVTEVPGYQGYSLPQSELRRREHIGRNLLDRLVKSGEVDSYVLGARIRHVVMASWYAYIARCQAGGLPRDPVEKARAAETYKLSIARSIGAKATKLARSAWGPDHGKRGGSKHLSRKRAPSTQRVSPPAAAAPKTSPGKARRSRKEAVAPAQ